MYVTTSHLKVKNIDILKMNKEKLHSAESWEVLKENSLLRTFTPDYRR